MNAQADEFLRTVIEPAERLAAAHPAAGLDKAERSALIRKLMAAYHPDVDRASPKFVQNVDLLNRYAETLVSIGMEHNVPRALADLFVFSSSLPLIDLPDVFKAADSYRLISRCVDNIKERVLETLEGDGNVH